MKTKISESGFPGHACSGYQNLFLVYSHSYSLQSGQAFTILKHLPPVQSYIYQLKSTTH